MSTTEPNGGADREYPAGIRCPRCDGTRWQVYRTSAGPGRITRVRKCSRCGKQTRTVEVIETGRAANDKSPPAAA
jgi:DNA-directed RNA polymerase subunit RPC12/RpoP